MVYSNCQCSFAFLFFDLLFNLLRIHITVWPSFHLCYFDFSALFPIWCLERDVEFDCFGS